MTPIPSPDPSPGSFFLRAWHLLRGRRWLAELATGAYIALIAVAADKTGVAYILFPELGALAHDIFQRPHGTWSKAPLMLVVTPFLTAVIGTLLTQHLPYGVVSVLLSVGSSILIIRSLRSPVAPAISAGLLPLTLGIPSWMYPPSILIGTVMLALISIPWRRLAAAPPAVPSPGDLAADITEQPPRHYTWVPFFLAFLVGTVLAAEFTGWRFLLFPPLVVMGFEMFAHSAVCPWANRPVILPVACTLTAAGGVLLVSLFGVGSLAAIGSTLFGVLVLRVLKLHVPPAVAVGLLPFVIDDPGFRFPIAVGLGTALLTGSFLLWRTSIRFKRTMA